jgi:hypothetical protein
MFSIVIQSNNICLQRKESNSTLFIAYVYSSPMYGGHSTESYYLKKHARDGTNKRLPYYSFIHSRFIMVSNDL